MATKAQLTQFQRAHLESVPAGGRPPESPWNRGSSPPRRRPCAQRSAEVVKSPGYTVEVIIKGLADLPASIFGDTIDTVARRLTDEASRLEQLGRAIDVETAYAKHLNDISIAADALSILKQEQPRGASRASMRRRQGRKEALDAEIQSSHSDWDSERAQHEAEVKKYEEKLARDRKEGRGRLWLRPRAEAQARGRRHGRPEREDGAAARRGRTPAGQAVGRSRRALAARRRSSPRTRARVEAFPQEVDEAVKKAREEALKEGFGEAKVKAELLEKEVEGNRKVYALQISSMEETPRSKGSRSSRSRPSSRSLSPRPRSWRSRPSRARPTRTRRGAANANA